MAAWKKAAVTVGGILLVLLIVFGAGILVAKHYLNKINRVDESTVSTISPEDEDFEVDELPPETTNSGVERPMDSNEILWAPVEPLKDEQLINLMLVGQDRRKGEGRQRSDTMILCSINPKTNQVSLISFMRDLYVQIPGGYSDNRLNAAYYFGGFPLLDDAMFKNFGITIDGNIGVDFERFVKVIDVLGGVDIVLTAEEANYLGKGTFAGKNHLDGEMALEYARIRAIDNDFYRTARQRAILEAAFKKMKDLGLSEITALLNAMLPSLTTDLSDGQILALMGTLFPGLRSMEIQSYRVPADQTYYDAMIRGMAVLVPDLERIQELLRTEYLPLRTY